MPAKTVKTVRNAEARINAAQAVAPGRAAPDAGNVPWLIIRGARHNNLKSTDAAFPIGRFTCVTGVSGSGKSSLVNDILYKALARHLNGATTLEPGRHDGIVGLRHLDKIIAIDQSPIGRTPRSNPATYIKVFDEIRSLFAKLPDAKLRGYKNGRFSFNVAASKGGGRCEACEGNGANRIAMDFLADVWVKCPVCEGRRFGRETLQIKFKNKSIYDVLELEIRAALELFDSQIRIHNMLQTLHDVGLDYIRLGQSSTTLSGGEAQRIKLARELVKKATGRTLYVLDEPTTGLHFEDIRKLLEVLHGFVDAGNTVVVIEHNLDVLKTADWIIDLGPEGGDAGGWIVAEGTPESVAETPGSFTGEALLGVLQSGKWEVGSGKSRAVASVAGPSHFPLPTSNFVSVRGARQHNLKDISVSFPRDRMTVCTGVSGSGKSSFAVDTVFTEGYRRYVESLSAYARQFLGQLQKPRVDHIEGLSPAICIEQRSASRSPRSTVGTVTEVYDYMRVLWARVGQRCCPNCAVPIGTQTVDEIVARVMGVGEGMPIILLAPIALGENETYASLFNRLKASGYTRVRIDGEIRLTAECTTLDPRRKHRAEVVVDRTVVREKSRGRISESVEHALGLGNGVMTLLVEAVELVEEGAEGGEEGAKGPRGQGAKGEAERRTKGAEGQRGEGAKQREGAGVEASSSRTAVEIAAAPQSDMSNLKSAIGASSDPLVPRPLGPSAPSEVMFSQKLACLKCGTSFEELGPNHYSFNHQLGWCETCEGLGVQRGAAQGEVIKNPAKSLFNGAIAGWPRIEPRTPLGKLLAQLCAVLGVAPSTPLRDWTAEQKRALMFGSDGGWIDSGDAFNQGRHASGVRFKWRGFFPTMDHATRNSWSFRYKLRNVVTDIPCVTCRGGRLRLDASATRLGGRTITDVCDLPLMQTLAFFAGLKLDSRERHIAGEVLKEITSRLQFLIDVGLDYLTLHRAAPTLSGGESQRIRLASQIGSGLTGVLYVLDEPTIGLHPRDTLRLIHALTKLRDLGNTLLLVEHDRDVIAHADRVLDFGPRAGREGGRIVANGTPAELAIRHEATKARRHEGQEAEPATEVAGPDVGGAGRAGGVGPTASAAGSDELESLTCGYLSGAMAIPAPSNRRPVDRGVALTIMASATVAATTTEPAPPTDGPVFVPDDDEQAKSDRRRNRRQRADPDAVSADGAARGAGKMPAPPGKMPAPQWLVIRGARQNNLEDLVVPIPLARLVVVTGVSGSGKSSLVNDILYPALARELHGASLPVGEHDRIDGVQQLLSIVNVDQSPIGTTPSSNPATYTGVFDQIRELFARLPESKLRGWSANRFSFNRPGGRCEACEGQGQRCIEMHFMADVWVECETCRGQRYNPETLEVRFKGKNIAEVLEMRVAEALELFASVPKVKRMLRTLSDIGLDYVPLGQSATTLSGGEAQRVKLATELGKPQTGRTLYILDEPTTGLHFDDVRKLLAILHRLADLGNSVLVVEHNLDVIKSADFIIELGPEAGDNGGRVVAMGTPEEVCAEVGSGNWEVGSGDARSSARVGTSHFPIPTSHFGRTATAEALAPILAAGRYAVRAPFDAAAAAQEELAAERAGYGDVGKEVRMPWQVDGRKWHLEQRRSRDESERKWEPEALLLVLELVEEEGAALAARLGSGRRLARGEETAHRAAAHPISEPEAQARVKPRSEAAVPSEPRPQGRGPNLFSPVNWNDRASVEVSAPGAEIWFLHALTGGEWLVELYFRVPPKTFNAMRLNVELGLRTLDQRDDLQTYGDWPRVDVRQRQDGWDAVVVYAHDCKELDTPAFRRFIKKAVAAYAEGVASSE